MCFSVLISLVNSTRDPQKKCQIQILFLFNAIQTYTKWVFGSTLSCVSRLCFPFLFFFIIHAQQLLGDSTLFMHYSLLFVHYSLLFVQCSSWKKNIKNRSHDTIHTFKNYFAKVFSVLTKISCIQTDPKYQNTNINRY